MDGLVVGFEKKKKKKKGNRIKLAYWYIKRLISIGLEAGEHLLHVMAQRRIDTETGSAGEIRIMYF